MKKLVQLKNKENENLDPINLNYEKRISKNTEDIDSLKGTILYEVSGGNAGNIPLNDNMQNYKSIEIYFHQGGAYGYTKIPNPYHKTFALNLRNYYNDESIHNCVKNYYVNDTELQVVRGANSIDKIGGELGAYSASTDIIYIEKVVGNK